MVELTHSSINATDVDSLGVILTPADPTTLDVIFPTPDTAVRCQKCSAYISTLCDRTDTSWKCAICGEQNSTPPTIFYNESPDYTALCEETSGEPITAIFISRQFHKSDLDQIIPAVQKALLATPPATSLLLFEGSQSHLSVILPQSNSYIIDNSTLIINDYLDKNAELTENPSPVISITSLTEINLLKALVSKRNIKAALESFKLIQTGKSFLNIFETAKQITQAFPNSPVHFISVVPSIPSQIHPGKLSNLRMTFLVAQFSEQLFDIAANMPGAVLPFSRRTLSSVLDSVLDDKGGFNALIGVRCLSGTIEWIPRPFPYKTESEVLLYSPGFGFATQPFVASIKPNEGAKEIVFQITVQMLMFIPKARKYLPVLRVFNRRVGCGESVVNERNAAYFRRIQVGIEEKLSGPSKVLQFEAENLFCFFPPRCFALEEVKNEKEGALGIHLYSREEKETREVLRELGLDPNVAAVCPNGVEKELPDWMN